MGTLDIVLLICFLPALVSGLSKGFVRQVMGLAALFLGAWAGFRYGLAAAEWLGAHCGLEGQVLQIAAFALVAAFTILVLALLARILAKALDLAALGWADRLLGLVFALLKAALLLGLALLVFDSLNGSLKLVDPEKLGDSVIAPWLRKIALQVFPYLKELVAQIHA